MYKYDLKGVKNLSNLTTDEDIKQLSNAIFPGTHCPLFGSLMVASYIKGLMVLNVGTEECTFYGKDFSHRRQKGQDNVYSMVTNKRDITFGFQDKLTQTIKEIIAIEKPDAMLVISTCVVELIGEDIEAIVDSIQPDVEIPLLTIKTEHFKCNSHIPGIRDTLSNLTKVMARQEGIHQGVNVLGHRYDGFEETELCHLLKEHDIEVKMSIPSSTSIDLLRDAPNVKLNIVTDFSALMLAKKMEEEFGVPFVIFEKFLSPERIKENYLTLAGVLAIDIDDFVNQEYKKVIEQMDQVTNQLSGKTFVYGNTPFKALEMSAFLARMDIKPDWIQMRELYEDDFEYKEELLALGYDPLISRIANVVPMRDVYDEYKPSMYIGHENPMELMRRGISQLTFDIEGKGLGFELPVKVMEKLINVIIKKRPGGMMAMNPQMMKKMHQKHMHMMKKGIK